MTNPINTNTTTHVNLNTADAKALRSLPGVGAALAQAIISDREARGAYATASDLRRVPGVGPKTWARIASLVCAGGAQGGAVEDVKRAPRLVAEASPSAAEAAVLDDVSHVFAATDDEEIRPPGPGQQWTRGQVEAIKAIRRHMRTRRGEVFVLRGYAGTGKTTLLVEALRPFAAPSLLAPTQKARAILEPKAEILGGTASTLHRWLGYQCNVDEETGEEVFRRASRDPKYDPKSTVPVVLDEVSMVGNELWREFVEDVRRFRLMAVAMGDPLQLPPVGEDASPAWSCPATVELTEVMRSQGVLTGVVLGVRERIDDEVPPCVVRDASDTMSSVEVATNKIEMLREYHQRVANGEDAIMVAWTNRVVEWANAWMRSRIVGDSRAPFVVGEVLVLTQPYRLDEEPATWWGDDGQPRTVMIRRMIHTEQRIQVVSAELGRHPHHDDACWVLQAHVVGFSASPMVEIEAGNDDEDDDDDPDRLPRVVTIYALDSSQVKAHRDRVRHMQMELATAHTNKDPEARHIARHLAAYRSAYLRARPGYATTVHKSQGSTWQHVYVVQGDVIKNSKPFERNRLLYVAFSRAAKRLVVYG